MTRTAEAASFFPLCGGGPSDRCQPEPTMSIPRTVAEVIREHVTLEVEGIDRMYLNVYQPKLQHDRGVVTFFRFHRQQPFVSSALMAPISTAFVKNTEAFALANNV